MLTPLICLSRGLASTNQGRANSISFSSHLGQGFLVSLSLQVPQVDFLGGRKGSKIYIQIMLFGEKAFLQRGKSPTLFLFLPHLTGSGFFGGSGGGCM